MAKLSLSVLTFLLLFSFSFAVKVKTWQQGECQIDRINAQEPSNRIQAEGGVSEFWILNDDSGAPEFLSIAIGSSLELSCCLLIIMPLFWLILFGTGYHGVMVSGCPETFESSQQSEQFQEGRSRKFLDRHQKIGQFRRGDIVAIPAGAAHWVYNNGDQELLVVVLQDNTNNANQLDQNPRSFFLAGNPQREQEQQQFGHGRIRRGQHEFGNVFKGFDIQTLAEVFGVDEETARKLQNENDERGHLIIVERGLQVIKPPLRERNMAAGKRSTAERRSDREPPGQAVFDGQVREGQVVVVPQNFAVVKQAGEQGCEWVEFNTNDNAMINTLSGRTSALRGLPVDVIANAYQISREEAERLKYNREETLIFSGRSRSGRGEVASA
ncbi:hypothetical protein BUALT_Bualt13G0020100 [Buddleja alternifolia]|uniref:Cupin type-1 domain-containing protein n=1 Tax=Buddleja alternifolia TaxID=168488 RepID=A0AAV6WPG3_9LAMI|nr:hypothetical protein BUALT_Bualt13G0020100 [Buddleja alternifolia]